MTNNTKFTFEFEVSYLEREQHAARIINRITDGIGEAIKVVLAQHNLRPLPNSRIIIEVPLRKEVANGE